MLGFPCNQFGAQEPGTNDEIAAFAKESYQVEGDDFPMFAKVDVNGENAHPLFKHLEAEAAADDGNADIAWNFNKFLVGREGEVLKRYAPQVTPEEIQAELGQFL